MIRKLVPNLGWKIALYLESRLFSRLCSWKRWWWNPHKISSTDRKASLHSGSLSVGTAGSLRARALIGKGRAFPERILG